MRFLLHHDVDTVDYIMKKVVPHTDMQGLFEIVYWYCNQNNEKGEFIWSPSRKLLDQIFHKAIEMMENDDANLAICVDILIQLSQLYYKTESVDKLYEFTLDKLLEKLSEMNLSSASEEIYSQCSFLVSVGTKFNYLKTDDKND